MYSKYNTKISRTQLTQLLTELGSSLKTHNLVIDSRQVIVNSIFCAYLGVKQDGREFIDAAIKNGADIILYEGILNDEFTFVPEVKYIRVNDLLQYIGLLASIKYDEPSDKFTTIGVTGTNGKTSITHWLSQAYGLVKQKVAIIGTTGAGIYPNITDYAMTTPDPITLQKLLADFATAKVVYLAMEVSSHALHQGRVNGVGFKTAIFTNLTPDHLDYHKTLDEYFRVKKELFYWQDLEHAIINLDDKYGLLLYNELQQNSENQLHLLSYGVDNSSCDLYAFDIIMGFSGMEFKLNYRGQIQSFQVKVIGKFNIYNLLAVIAQLIIDGYILDKISQIVKQLKPVCGRMDIVTKSDSEHPMVVVDYAHTPDALYNTLITLRQIPHLGKIYCVFGCGGDRDKSKRSMMGAVAIANADYVIVTTDNPRSELPHRIIEDIVSGIPLNKKNYYQIIEDRQKAIEYAILQANTTDIVLIAGKGHETYQEVNGVKYDFSDFKVAQNSLASLANSS